MKADKKSPIPNKHLEAYSAAYLHKIRPNLYNQRSKYFKASAISQTQFVNLQWYRVNSWVKAGNCICLGRRSVRLRLAWSCNEMEDFQTHLNDANSFKTFTFSIIWLACMLCIVEASLFCAPPAELSNRNLNSLSFVLLLHFPKHDFRTCASMETSKSDFLYKVL